MAYTQNPGRGNKSKTGSGIPSPLRQDVEPTEKYIKGKKKYQQNAEKGFVGNGISVDPATGIATAKPYEKRIVKNSTGGVFIVGGDNETIASARNYGQGREVEQLQKRFTADSTNTMKQRNESAEFWNANSGGTKWENLSPRQKQWLSSLGKASPAKQKKKMAPAKMKKC